MLATSRQTAVAWLLPARDLSQGIALIRRKGASPSLPLASLPSSAVTVLVADNDSPARAAIADLLTGQGYQVVLATDGEEALQLARQGGIDLLVSAMAMRGMDGLELLRALRDEAIDLPAVAIAPGGRDIDDIYLRGASLLGVARTYRQPLLSGAFLQDIQNLLTPGLK